MRIRARPNRGLIFMQKIKNRKEKNMKKGIIVAITVAICAVLAATYTFANPSKAAKTEPTTKEKEVKEVTTTEKEKTTTEATTESKKAAIEEEASEESDTDQELDDSEETEDQEEEIDSEDEDNKEIDDGEIDRCNHEWTEPSYAIDPEKGYVITQDCKKCHLVKDTSISEEEYEEATKDQEPDEKDCTYEDDDDAEVVE